MHVFTHFQIGLHWVGLQVDVEIMHSTLPYLAKPTPTNNTYNLNLNLKPICVSSALLFRGDQVEWKLGEEICIFYRNVYMPGSGQSTLGMPWDGLVERVLINDPLHVSLAIFSLLLLNFFCTITHPAEKVATRSKVSGENLSHCNQFGSWNLTVHSQYTLMRAFPSILR